MRQDMKASRLHQTRVLSVLIIVLIGAALVSISSIVTADVTRSNPAPVVQTPPAQAPKTAEQAYKNIQVLKGVPASDVESTMAFISGSLGVKCGFCHVNPFAKDEKPEKQTARKMIQMVLDLNKNSFAGEKAVSCFTCHQGKPTPFSVPAVGPNLWQPTAAAKDTPLPTADEILQRYVAAIGGAEALQKITSRVAKGQRVGADGVLVPEEIYQKAPNKMLTITTYPENAFTTGFNGTAGWGLSTREGRREMPESMVAQLKKESDFYKEMKTTDLYRKLAVVGKSTISDREVYVIEATPDGGRAEKLYFDASTGLLMRKYVETATFFGWFPLQTDYDDYRAVDGIKQPFLIRWSMPGRSWGRKIAEIKQNVDIDDGRFEAPAVKP